MVTALWRSISLVALLILGQFPVRAETPPPSPVAVAWEDAQRAAQAKNPPGVTCTLHSLNGQTRFQQGATIRLTAAFSSDRPGYKLNGYNDGRRGMFPFGTIHVAPEAGTTDPVADWPPPHGWGYDGPGPPDPVVLNEKPFALRFNLNEWLRFDRPGLYHVYVMTQRVLIDTGKASQGGFSALFSQRGLETTSDILQLEIVPADPAWAHAQVEAQRARWADKTEHYTAPALPEGELSYLGTREAAQAIIERMGTNTRPRSSEDETWNWQPALIGFPDRDWLIAEMERAVARPNYPVTQGFVDTLALLAPCVAHPTLWQPMPHRRSPHAMRRGNGCLIQRLRSRCRQTGKHV